MRYFNATVTREDGYWVAVVDGVPGGATEARRLSALHAEVLDLLAGLLDLEEAQIQINYDYSSALGEEATDQLDRYVATQSNLVEARTAHEEAQRAAVRDLRAADVSLRDAAELLGISFQRVQQLEAASHAAV